MVEIETKRRRKTGSTENPDKILLAFPHLATKNEVPEPQTIFGQKLKSLTYITSDEMWNGEQERSIQAARTANDSGVKTSTQRWHEAYLSAYLGEEVNLKHIMVGFNSNARSYRIYGYRPKGQVNRKPVQKQVAKVLEEVSDL